MRCCRDSYNLHPYVKNKVFTVALNGTLKSSDVVNVTVTVPDDLAASITNVTAAGYSYISFAFNNVTDTDTFQVQFPPTGYPLASLTWLTDIVMPGLHPCPVCVGRTRISDSLTNLC